MRAVTGARGLEPEQRRRRILRRGEIEVKRRIDVGRRNQLHALERLQPALGLAGFARLVAESLDEPPHVGDLALLLAAIRLALGELGGALRLEGRVVAAVDAYPGALHVGDVTDQRIDELAIVGNQQQRALIAAEPALEPDDRVQIQMIGRLVEQQQIRTADQRLGEVQPHAPATGE